MTKAFTRVLEYLRGQSTGNRARYAGLVAKAGERAEAVGELTDDELQEATNALGNNGFGDAELVELCALGREAAERFVQLRPYDVQLLGTLRLLGGAVVQMDTGEGKTLSGALAAIGFVLRTHHVHIVTVNDYLARRDAEWMDPLYQAFGVTVGWITAESTPEQRRTAYAADVVYGSVNEFGFDVLRDRLATEADELIVPEPDVAIVDEADSVLVDEARVPLVLAGATEGDSANRALPKIMRTLRPGLHYDVDADRRNVFLTPTGSRVVERELGGIDLYSPEHVAATLPAVNVALHAEVLLRKDVDYIVRDQGVHLVNPTRGRIAVDQRWPDGLQAAVEAKEALPASETGEVLDTITIQALLGRYPTKAGMTGTAVAVREQLREFYDLGVEVVEPNTPCIRVDEPDRVFASIAEKEDALVELITEQHETGRPVLVGTLDVAESEKLAARLAEAGVECVALNAKNDAEEAAIIANAGTFGAVTVSTQLAGRGTDIRLGGPDGADHERVVELGGLYVIGTGRHISSRLDDQLRGRAGRQGDPGGSVFFASTADELVTSYAAEYAETAEDWVIVHAQRVAERVHLEIHRDNWRYTRLAELHRRLLDERRDALLRTDIAATELAESCQEHYEDRYVELVDSVGEEAVVHAARQIALYHLDRGWVEHLTFLADLREGIHLHSLARNNPLDEFHRAAIPAFRAVVPTARERTEQTFATAEITADGVDLGAAGLHRPRSTWTYLVHDNPFGPESERMLKSVADRLRSKRHKPR